MARVQPLEQTELSRLRCAPEAGSTSQLIGAPSLGAQYALPWPGAPSPGKHRKRSLLLAGIRLPLLQQHGAMGPDVGSYNRTSCYAMHVLHDRKCDCVDPTPDLIAPLVLCPSGALEIAM